MLNIKRLVVFLFVIFIFQAIGHSQQSTWKKIPPKDLPAITLPRTSGSLSEITVASGYTFDFSASSKYQKLLGVPVSPDTNNPPASETMAAIESLDGSQQLLTSRKMKRTAVKKECPYCLESYTVYEWEPCEDCEEKSSTVSTTTYGMNWTYSPQSISEHGIIRVDSPTGSFETCNVEFQRAMMNLTHGKFTPASPKADQ